MGYIFWRAREPHPVHRVICGWAQPDQVDSEKLTHMIETAKAEGNDVFLASFEILAAAVTSGDALDWQDAVSKANLTFGAMEAAGPLAKNIGPERTEAIRQQLGLGVGDAAFFLGGKPDNFQRVAGKARDVLGTELKLIDENRFAFAWIVDFPIYEQDEESGKIDFEHNPFSMPQGGMDALLGDPLAVKGFQYDLACNGYELVSGAIRNHKPDVMLKAFEIAGYGEEEVKSRFGALFQAFHYGAPPHGGCAAGIDRIVMLLAETANIREVIMFPMNQRAEDLMMNAPSDPSSDQLMELSLRVIPQE
jgi:aspartyl-tRNA synthetase